jgi:ribosomal protein L11 methyltransferase
MESNRESAEQLSELLEKFNAVSVSLSALSEEVVFGQGVNDAPVLWDRTRTTALLHEDTDLDTLLVCLRDRVGAENIPHHHIDLVQDKDWVNEYKQGQAPKIYGEKFCVCPSWCDPPDGIKQYVILDPGLAFGTGTHDTTSLCLKWLASNDISGSSVIDYGCGSGILALAALRLGANKAYAIDIDPQALQATIANAERNDLTENIIIAHPEDVQLPVADILLANILLNPLQGLAPKFAGLIRPGGNIVLSGILAVQAEECLETFQTWFNMGAPVFRQEWTILQGMRK